MPSLDIDEYDPDKSDADNVRAFLHQRKAANDSQPEYQYLEDVLDYHSAQDEFDLARRTWTLVEDAFSVAKEAQKDQKEPKNAA